MYTSRRRDCILSCSFAFAVNIALLRFVDIVVMRRGLSVRGVHLKAPLLLALRV